MVGNEKKDRSVNAIRRIAHLVMPIFFMIALLAKESYGASMLLQVVPVLQQVQTVLAQIGPALSAVLFIVAGVFYALGQILPPDKKAQFHTTAVNIIIGAIVIGALSIASTSLATASTHLLSNITSNTAVL